MEGLRQENILVNLPVDEFSSNACVYFSDEFQKWFYVAIVNASISPTKPYPHLTLIEVSKPEIQLVIYREQHNLTQE
ncbi:hypothetical protein H6F77_11700 [Microcoleus sp. FACHB-831]|uniref:hypothetical protein n=1 Tax=Microcoleus sp. FACHB-831 TaxID=2692827 RepID=UPI00168762B1|nr:hypothetical protein [Microcoleus sp. FACHB-831]MBD1921756.1 hypothetical protein [Microcoleus sp. FACHB-831]